MKTLNFYKHNIFAIGGMVVLLLGLVMPATVLAAPPATMQAGIDPNHPIALSITAGQDMPETGTLAPGQQVWYAVTVNDPNGAYIGVNEEHNKNAPGVDTDAKDKNDTEQTASNNNTSQSLDQPPFNLSLFVTPGNGNNIDNVQMDLFPDSYAQQWSVGKIYTPGMDNPAGVAPFGTGSVVDHSSDNFHGDPNVGELTYGGRVIGGQTFLVEIQNGNAQPISYHLYTAHLDNVTF